MNEEDVIYFLKILEVGFISGIKFLFAPFEAERQGFNFRESFFITTTGGFIGILVFTFVGEVIAYAWKKMINFFRKPLQKERTPKKKFTWLNKFIIKTKMRFGLLGLLLTTPFIISIPIGTFMVHRFYRKKGKNILLLMLSVMLWSLVLNEIAQYLKLSQYIPQ